MTENPELQQNIAKSAVKYPKGASFLLESTDYKELFIPEDFDEEQIMVRDMCKGFLEQSLFPQFQAFEKRTSGLAESLLEEMGELGMLGAHMPESYGGLDLDTNTVTLICDVMGPSGGFNVTYAVQTGIGMLPIFYFGTEAQKTKFLPDLISGKRKACYCLTEPNSGSDALSSRSTAVLNEEGTHYLLNGQKMWISSSGFADIFIVFAKIDGEHFTGFIVEKGDPGMTLGAEEDKMGIKGSSTRQVFFEQVKIPVEHVLGEIGKGHLIAFNVLNMGRFKLGAMCVGGAKVCTDRSVKYANERVQFKSALSNFGAIQYKLAQQAILSFTSESALYRASDQIKQKKAILKSQGKSASECTLEAAEEFAIECAIMKVLGSEILDYVVDENVQVHGGIGFSEEYDAARAYRDSRINRIYEGTNEINRLLIVNMIMKRAMKGALDITSAALAVQEELKSDKAIPITDGPYGKEEFAVAAFRKLILMTLGLAAQAQMKGKIDLKDEQEILMNISDMIIQFYAAESSLLRVQKLAEMNHKVEQEVYDAMIRVFIYDTNEQLNKWAKDALASLLPENLLAATLPVIEKFTPYAPVNVKSLRRIVAGKLKESNSYCF